MSGKPRRRLQTGYDSHKILFTFILQLSLFKCLWRSTSFDFFFNRRLHREHFHCLFFFLCYQKAEGVGDNEEEVLDEETKKKDQIVKGAIDGLTREYAAELNAPSQDEDSQRRKRKKEKKEEVDLLYWRFDLRCFLNCLNCFYFVFVFQDDINTIDMEEDKRDLISREISKFRDTHKVKVSLLSFVVNITGFGQQALT